MAAPTSTITKTIPLGGMHNQNLRMVFADVVADGSYGAEDYPFPASLWNLTNVVSVMHFMQNVDSASGTMLYAQPDVDASDATPYGGGVITSAAADTTVPTNCAAATYHTCVVGW